MVLMPLLSRLLTLLVILTMPLFLARLTLIPIKSLSICFRVISISITTILKRRGCLTVPRLTLTSLIKMMLVMVSVAAISKTFGLLRFLLRLSFLAKRSEERFSRNAETDLVCRLLLEKKKKEKKTPQRTIINNVVNIHILTYITIFN